MTGWEQITQDYWSCARQEAFDVIANPPAAKPIEECTSQWPALEARFAREWVILRAEAIIKQANNKLFPWMKT